MKKMISWLGAVGALVSSAYAASATVWTEEGEGKMAPAYWYTFKYGTGASIDTSTTAANVKVGEMTATDSKTANGAGFGLTWKQNADYEDTPVSLSAYKGVCLTYKATAPFRKDLPILVCNSIFNSKFSAALSNTRSDAFTHSSKLE